jgi:hypothetical protein
MDFTYIQFSHDKDDCLYFTGKDENNHIKLIEFQPIEYDRICVSVKENEKWIILEILED